MIKCNGVNEILRDYSSAVEFKNNAYTIKLRGDEDDSYFRFMNGFLIIDDRIKEIGANAFKNCNGIKAVYILDGVEKIGANAFYCCNGLEKVIIGSDVVIDDTAFSECSNLETVKIYKGNIQIGNEAFSKCFSLNEVKLSDTVQSIGNEPFMGCVNLDSVEYNGNDPIVKKKIKLPKNTRLLENNNNTMVG